MYICISKGITFFMSFVFYRYLFDRSMYERDQFDRIFVRNSIVFCSMEQRMMEKKMIVQITMEHRSIDRFISLYKEKIHLSCIHHLFSLSLSPHTHIAFR